MEGENEIHSKFLLSRNQRIHIHKTFDGLASRGKCSMGWFFGFKLHLIINDKGEILNFVFTTGGVDDREPLKEGTLLKNIRSFNNFIANALGAIAAQPLTWNLSMTGNFLYSKIILNSRLYRYWSMTHFLCERLTLTTGRISKSRLKEILHYAQTCC